MLNHTLENKTWIIILALVVTAVVLGIALVVALPELSAVDATVAFVPGGGGLVQPMGWVWSG